MRRSEILLVGLIVAVHHFVAVYSVSAERFSLPLAQFSSEALFPAILIVNAIPFAVAALIGASLDKLLENTSILVVLFVTAFIIFSTIQWILIGFLISRVVEWFRNRG